MERKVSAIAYETVQLHDGPLPLLAPMSEVAGRMAPHVGGRVLEKGLEEALRADPVLARGLNTYGGALSNRALAEAQGLDHVAAGSLPPGVEA
jgi:alanine dehydrogenase